MAEDLHFVIPAVPAVLLSRDQEPESSLFKGFLTSSPGQNPFRGRAPGDEDLLKYPDSHLRGMTLKGVCKRLVSVLFFSDDKSSPASDVCSRDENPDPSLVCAF
jgi:hypothetical protein